MNEFFKSIEKLQLLQKPELGVLIASIAVFITIIVLWLLKRSPNKGNLVLLLGVSNSGKTTLFAQLVYKKLITTHTSISQNIGTAVIEKSQNNKEKNIHLVDIPGNDKIRKKYLDAYKNNAKALIFVIDSSTLQKDLKDVALYIYEVMTDSQLSRKKLSVLIVCNKQDIELAKGKTLIKSNIEKEIELLRKISLTSLKSTSSSKETSSIELRSSKDTPFSFDDLKYIKVDFEETSALDQVNVKKTIGNWMIEKL